MTTLVLCNVGNRDLVLEGETGPPRPPREKGRKLLDEYATTASRLRFPIIEPCLRYIVAQSPGHIDRLVLYGTDQEDPTHQSSDTLHFAELAARRLPSLLGNALRAADWQAVTGINPALYDEAFETYDRLLNELPRSSIEICHVIVTGGIPACNTALLFQGVRHFADRLRVVYLPQRGESQELRVGQQVMDAFREAAAVEHLQRMDFANALPRLERLGADPGLAGLVAYAARRFSFDFRSAQDALLEALRDGDRSVRAFIHQRLRHDLDPLLANDVGHERLASLLRELYWNAAITYRHRRYADFLGRVYRFQEAVLRYLVEMVFSLPTDLGPGVRESNQRRWKEGIRAISGLVAFLEAREVEGKPLDWEVVGRPTYKALMSYATDEAQGLDAEGKPLLSSGERKKYTALLKRVNRLDLLVELRHRTIIGHDFEGVSEALLLEGYKGSGTPLEGLREIMGMLNVSVHHSPYEAIAEFVVQRLREE